MNTIVFLKFASKNNFLGVCEDYVKKIGEMIAENSITEDVTYGLKGKVAQYNRKTPELAGGAEQYTLPLSADSLITIKVFEKIK